jgi:glutaredoxin 2
LEDIYYYKYYYNKSNKKEGKYSQNFKINAKIIRNCNNSEEKLLKKFVFVNDNINNESQIRNLIIIPFKEKNNLMKIFHKITGNKNYNILHEKILSERLLLE